MVLLSIHLFRRHEFHLSSMLAVSHLRHWLINRKRCRRSLSSQHSQCFGPDHFTNGTGGFTLIVTLHHTVRVWSPPFLDSRTSHDGLVEWCQSIRTDAMDALANDYRKDLTTWALWGLVQGVLHQFQHIAPGKWADLHWLRRKRPRLQ